MSKMGISTLQSYRGRADLRSRRPRQNFVDRYFTWTASRIGGAASTPSRRVRSARHVAFLERPLPIATSTSARPVAARREIHLFNPDTVYKLQHDAQRPVQDLGNTPRR